MKDKNIVDALNRVLTECFGTPCIFKKFSAKAETHVSEPQGVLQGLYDADIEFYSTDCLSDCSIRESGTIVYHSEKVAQNFECNAYLLYGSKLRKKILKAMLKHNGECCLKTT